MDNPETLATLDTHHTGRRQTNKTNNPTKMDNPETLAALSDVASVSGLSIFVVCFVFVLCDVYPMLPVSLDCPFLFGIFCL
jgi:hypothetical protein